MNHSYTNCDSESSASLYVSAELTLETVLGKVKRMALLLYQAKGGHRTFGLSKTVCPSLERIVRSFLVNDFKRV